MTVRYHPLYASYRSMIRRCKNINDPGYKNYGGRGISVCLNWHNFQNFLIDMGERPEGKTLERMNNNGNYEPKNCCWATREEQNNNRRPRSQGPQAQYLFFGLGPTGEYKVSNNQSRFAKQYGLRNSDISNCIAGRQKTCKGWRFEKLVLRQ